MGKANSFANSHEWVFVPLQDDMLPWYDSDETDTGLMLKEMETALSAYLPRGTRPHFQKRRPRPDEACRVRTQYVVASDRELIGILARTLA